MIIRPLSELSIQDRLMWNTFCQLVHDSGQEVPISQTLPWALAQSRLGTESILVFDPQVGVGAILMAILDSANTESDRYLNWECQNGPLCLSDQPENLAHWLKNTHQLLLQLGSEKLSIRPRIRTDHHQIWHEVNLPYSGENLAATWILNTYQKADAFSDARFRRTLTRSQRALEEAQFTPALPSLLHEFYLNYRAFCAPKNLFTPPESWFQELLTEIDFDSEFRQQPFRLWLGDARCKTKTQHSIRSQILIYQTPFSAHYIHGYQDRLEGSSSLSPSAILHKLAYDTFGAIGIEHYDLNGALVRNQNDASPAQLSHYQGVDEFKRQMGGSYVSYRQPELKISIG
jgi:hypothetical protein